jgi:hypothetical protein
MIHKFRKLENKLFVKLVVLILFIAGYNNVSAVEKNQKLLFFVSSSGLKSDSNIQIQNIINFPALDTVTFGMADYNPGAEATSGLPVTYSSSDTNIVSINNNKLHLKDTGTVAITAYQSGDSNVLSTKATQKLLIVRAVIKNFDSTTTVIFGKADYSPGATNSLGLPILYSSKDTSKILIINNKVHLKAVGSATIVASIVKDSNIVVATAKQIINIIKGSLYAIGQTDTINCGKMIHLDSTNISFIGLAVGDNGNAIRSQLHVETTATNVMGKFPITVSGPPSYGNYNITYINGILFVKSVGPLGSVFNLCKGDSMLLPNDSIVRTNGTYLYTTIYNKGCDTVTAYTIKFISPDSVKIKINKCIGDSMQIGNIFVKTKGIYKDTIRRIYASCDSIYRTINLSFDSKPFVDAGIDQEICKGDSVILSATGTGYINWLGYTETIIKVLPKTTSIYAAVSTTACGDTLNYITVKVDAIPPKPNIYINNETFSTDINTSLYEIQWYESKFGAIKNAMNWKYTPKQNGNYFVVARNGQCFSTTSDTVTFNYTSVSSEILSNSEPIIFPNPVENDFKVSFAGGINRIDVYNTIGNKIVSVDAASSNTLKVDASTWMPGVYLIKVWPAIVTLKPIVNTVIKK